MNRFKHLMARVALTATTVAMMISAPGQAQAAQMTWVQVNTTDMTASLSYTGSQKIQVNFTPATTIPATTGTLTLTFTGETGMTSLAGDYTISNTDHPATLEGGTITVNNTNLSVTTVNGSTKVMVLTQATTSLTAGTTYGFSITPGSGKFINPASDQTWTVDANTGDSSSVYMPFVTSSNDAVTVSATVTPYMSQALSAGSSAIGTITGSATKTFTKGAAVTVTIVSNGIYGYTTQIYDTNAGLKSTRDNADHTRTAITGASLASGGTGTAGVSTSSKGLFGVEVALSAGGNKHSNYNTTNSGGVSAETIGGISTSAAEMTYSTDVSGLTTGDTFTITPSVFTTAITPAANDYADTLKILSASLF